MIKLSRSFGNLALLACCALAHPAQVNAAEDPAVAATKLLTSVTQKEVTDADVANMLRIATRNMQSQGMERASAISMNLAMGQRRKDVVGALIVESHEVDSVAAEAGVQDRRNQAVSAVRALRICGVSSERKECYVGAWIIRSGDSVTLRHQDQSFTFTVSSITAESVTFEELSTKSRIVARLNLVPSNTPPEMQPLP